MNELALIDYLMPRLPIRREVVIPPGDDCAGVLLPDGKTIQLLAVDQLISDVHYFRETTPPELAGAKLLKRNLSDIAAMGGVAKYALMTMAGAMAGDQYYQQYFDGLTSCARQYDVAVIGGDLALMPPDCPAECATLTIIGEVEADLAAKRNAGKSGEILAISGELGNSLASNHHLNFTPQLAEGRFLVTNHYTRCMMDISDGLLLDAARLGRASGVQIELDLSTLPQRIGTTLQGALSDGEDYGLLFTVVPELWQKLTREWPFSTPLTAIGQMRDGVAGSVLDTLNNDLLNRGKKGYEHKI
ncbi:MAG: thiamine-phosphate kinase [Lentisphaeria bacterium]|nr:thiamine-phosphate kinase [Lentisphaeria bacterium]